MNNVQKYPRTPHLPFSQTATSDDRFITAEALASLSTMEDLVVTEKMDGGNVTLYSDFIHARSTSGSLGPWDGMVKRLWEQIRYDIPTGWRITGESMWAERSVAYSNLPGVFMIFGVWDENNVLRSWDETEEWAELIGLPTVPVLYRGGDFKAAVKAWGSQLNDNVSEGYVVRNAGEFHYDSFSENMAKWVRADHVRTSADWRHRDDFAINGFEHV